MYALDTSSTPERPHIRGHRLLLRTVAPSPVHALQFHRALGSALPSLVRFSSNVRIFVAGRAWVRAVHSQRLRHTDTQKKWFRSTRRSCLRNLACAVPTTIGVKNNPHDPFPLPCTWHVYQFFNVNKKSKKRLACCTSTYCTPKHLFVCF